MRFAGVPFALLLMAVAHSAVGMATDAVTQTREALPAADSPRRGCAFPTLVCHQGKPAICLQELKDECGIEACAVRHEQQHLVDIANTNLDVCEERADGQLAQAPISHKVALELSAIKIERSCLRALLPHAEGSCRRSIADRLKRIDKFDEGCRDSAKACVSPILPPQGNERVDLCEP